MKKKILIITITILVFISCNSNFLPFNKYNINNYFSAQGVVRGTAIDFSTNVAYVEYINPETLLIVGHTMGLIGDKIIIRFNVDFITAYTIYTDTEIDGNSPINFQIESNLILESEGYHESETATGSLEIFEFDETILSGNYNIISDIGDTLSGSFGVYIP